MELAIPLIALGGMYVISNQKSSKTNNTTVKAQPYESFNNMGIRTNLATRTDNYLPNTNIPPQNYPVPNLNEISGEKFNIHSYPNPNVATDKYFDQDLYEKKVGQGIAVGQNPQQIYSLTGDYLNTDQFKHNNMKPFFGGKIKGYTYDTQIAENVLDNMTGNGSQTIKKIEQAPLFKPQENIQWAFGAPNNSDFYQSRVNPAMKNNNVKPFDSVYVGPGLDQGYGVNGSCGYNSGMEARDKWMPYTVDQMRVDTNPKLEYELTNHEGPAQAIIKNVGVFGRMEKQRPDTFFINSQDRWLTTTGAEKGETLRPIQELGQIRRPNCPTDYSGPAGTVARQAPTAPENYEQTRKSQLPTCDVPISTAVGKGPSDDGDIRLSSFTNPTNHRSTVAQPDGYRSGFSGAVGAVIAPIMDFLRPTRKEETINNVRIYGDGGTRVPSSYVNNPNDTTTTTIKETTLYAPSFNINNQKESMYVNNNTPLEQTQRDTTTCGYIGSSGGHATQYGNMTYESSYRQHNNDIKSSTIENRPNQGGMQLFNQEMHVSINRSDTDRFDGRMNPAHSRLSGLPPSAQTFGAIRSPQTYNENAGCDRLDGSLLEAFKKNPYTHSLTNSV
jgi:hypothetical protein